MILEGLFLGSIGVLAETSDIQRRAYNQALAEAGVDWHWDVAQYERLLTESGGRERLSRLSEGLGAGLSTADVDSIHARKTELACEEVRKTPVRLRPGVADIIKQALQRSLEIAIVTTTYRANIDAIAEAAGEELPLDRFSEVLTVSDAKNPKPAPDIYEAALDRLELDAGSVLAIEDSAASVRSAKEAGIYTVAVPGEFARHLQDFGAADLVVDSLEGFVLPDELP